MADLNKQGLKRDLRHTGAWGDSSDSWKQYTANAAAVDDVIFMDIIPAESDVTLLTLYTDALGGGVTLDVGYMNEDETVADYFFSGQAGSAVGQFIAASKPKYFEKKTYLTITVQGAAATGQIDSVVSYVNRGGH